MVWLVPLIAALVGLGLVVRSYLLAGPTVTITFDKADGLVQGKTEVKYKNVVVGKVEDISLAPDFKQVRVTVELTHSAAGLAVADTRFWVVRPRVDWSGVSGLGTLLSGAYIGVDIGDSKKERRHFKGLSQPPAILHDQHGSKFVLHAADLGSLNIGSPVYYRKVTVGRVAADQLDGDGKGVTVQVFIKAPYDKFVTDKTRFWNASGVNLSLGAGGLTLNTQSLVSVLAGGIAFAQLPHHGKAKAASQDSAFKLFVSKDAAMAPANGPPQRIQMRFHQSIKGLHVGAEVNFRGIDFGHVTAINMHYDPKRTAFWAQVNAVIYPDRLGPAQHTIERLGEARGKGQKKLIAALVKNGLRAQLRTGNLITGQLYVALDFFKDAHPVHFKLNQTPARIPTVQGALEQIQSQISDLIRKLDSIPFQRLGNHLDQTLRQLNTLLGQLNGKLAPQAEATLQQAQATLKQARHTLDSADRGLISPNAPIQQNAQQTLQSVQRAAQSLKALVNYLRRHPQSLIRGRGADTPPTTPQPPLAAPGAPSKESP